MTGPNAADLSKKHGCTKEFAECCAKECPEFADTMCALQQKMMTAGKAVQKTGTKGCDEDLKAKMEGVRQALLDTLCAHLCAMHCAECCC